MDAGSRLFEEKPLTILLGDQAAQIYVPKPILLQIPSLRTRLLSKTPSDGRLEIPHINPATAKDLIYLISIKDVPEIEMPDEVQVNEVPVLEAMRTRYVNAYILALRWGVYWVETPLRKAIVISHRVLAPSPSDLMQLYHANLTGSILYKFMVADFAWDFTYFSSAVVIEALSPHNEDGPEHMVNPVVMEIFRIVQIRLAKDHTGPNQNEAVQPAEDPEWLKYSNGKK